VRRYVVTCGDRILLRGFVWIALDAVARGQAPRPVWVFSRRARANRARSSYRGAVRAGMEVTRVC